jgi:hypothetical protein
VSGFDVTGVKFQQTLKFTAYETRDIPIVAEKEPDAQGFVAAILSLLWNPGLQLELKSQSRKFSDPTKVSVSLLTRLIRASASGF